MSGYGRAGVYQAIYGLVFMLALAACSPQPASPTAVSQAATATPAIPTATVSFTPLPTPTPLVVPTPGPEPEATCPGTRPERLILHERGRVLADDPRPLNLRSEPNTSSRRLTQIPSLGVFYVLQGPECNEEYAWYFVEYRGYEGWIAEGDLLSYYVEPYLPG
ncbi:MAG: SH3 domain-containing protein [Anaerolineaceae bacterium]|nr:SH3 domain-containing protein [Anaerolineaceae bacterium]